jgi:hypothetical protein
MNRPDFEAKISSCDSLSCHEFGGSVLRESQDPDRADDALETGKPVYAQQLRGVRLNMDMFQTVRIFAFKTRFFQPQGKPG